ncbi:aminodeoxychorismate lyase [Sulfobacillus acidophilus TPY]|uniref:Endolytic murein transglycosylase n=1 Tax=Sulfobacillus acidophilus (strain ATCC 700253 / DSM 10332 / NAL) TaxID=679936 RepID=G8TY97_SULAD|nr:aminodeoxychorismate lyase [Sulfobacillus acidophilus TPY]AEW05061.1 aminodeoxychorismate lyase [Sulfobacillus acidophilus DSM 10332]
MHRKVTKRFWWVVSLAAGGLLVGLLGIMVTLWVPKTPGSHMVRYVWVKPGQTATDVGYTLAKEGIIRSAAAFAWLSRFNGLARHLTSGVYRLSPGETLVAIQQQMRAGDVVTIRVVIPEGFTVQQIVNRLIAHHIGSPAAFRTLVAKPLPGMPNPQPGVRDPLEGYLFPATYQFPYNVTPRQALEIMWQTFQEKVAAISGGARLNLGAWVTLASIVQKETPNAESAPIIAAVFKNRLKVGMPLDSDATVRYALNHAVPGGLSLGDLTVASPYNTYLHPGLPPGPICNPGLSSLTAALHPATVPYLYFLTLRNGRVLYATTYAEHLANIAWANQHGGE